MFRIVIELLIDPIYLPNFFLLQLLFHAELLVMLLFRFKHQFVFSLLLLCVSLLFYCSFFLLSEHCSRPELHILDHENFCIVSFIFFTRSCLLSSVTFFTFLNVLLNLIRCPAAFILVLKICYSSSQDTKFHAKRSNKIIMTITIIK